MNFVSFLGRESLGGGGAARLFSYLQVPEVQARKKVNFDVFTLSKMSI